MYKVIADFKDLRDGGYAYTKGDIYPHEGVADEKRVNVLISPTIGRGALIEYVPDEEPKKAKAKPEPEVMVEEKPKRGRKKKDGV